MASFDLIIRIFSLAGALALFLYGMKIMSEALQKLASTRLKSILSSLTSNPFRGILSGFAITSVIQSSSATTVMVVSFVNAGILSLGGAIALIMGANIGTTMTGWIVSLLGLKLNLYAISLPIMGLALPLLFMKLRQLRSIGEFMMGFTLLFLGLHFMQSIVPSLETNSNFIRFVELLDGYGYWSVILFIIVGVCAAGLLQSSSASMALTLVLCQGDIISFQMGAAMILGENIGTTLTANLAALVASRQAKRAARVHFLFNIIGVIWMLPVFNLFLYGIDKMLTTQGLSSAYTDNTQIPIALAIFHTAFNLINTVLLAGFIPVLIKLSLKIIPQGKAEKKTEHLKYFEQTLLSTSEIDIIQARKEIIQMSKRLNEMIALTPLILSEIKNEKQEKIMKQVRKGTIAQSRIDNEINTFISRLAEKNLSFKTSEQLRYIVKISNEFLSLSNNVCEICDAIERKNNAKVWFTQNLRDNITRILDELNKAGVQITQTLISYDISNEQLSKNAIENINFLLEESKTLSLKTLNTQEHTPQAEQSYLELIEILDKIKMHFALILSNIVKLES